MAPRSLQRDSKMAAEGMEMFQERIRKFTERFREACSGLRKFYRERLQEVPENHQEVFGESSKNFQKDFETLLKRL